MEITWLGAGANTEEMENHQTANCQARIHTNAESNGSNTAENFEQVRGREAGADKDASGMLRTDQSPKVGTEFGVFRRFLHSRVTGPAERDFNIRNNA